MADNTTLIIGIVALVLITAGLTYLIAKSGEVGPIIINGTNQTSENPTITVRGEASKTVTPDLLTIGLSVEGNGTTVKESQQEAAAKMARVKSALLAEGVKESDIQTSSFYTQPIYNTTCDYPYGKPMPVEPDGGIGSSDSGGASGSAPSEAIAPDYYYPYPYPYCDYSQVIGYRTIHSVLVKTGQVNEGGELIDAATSDDDARFDYVYFSLKESTRIAIEEELQGMAAASAKAKAAKIAQGVGATLGRLVSINPDQYYYPYPVRGGVAYPEGDASAPPTEIFPSETTMSASMIVVYELEQ